MLLPCRRISALSGSYYSPLSGIDGIIYQCHKAALVPRVYLTLYVRADVLWGSDFLHHSEENGRKNKVSIRVPSSGVYLLDLIHQTLHKVALRCIVPPWADVYNLPPAALSQRIVSHTSIKVCDIAVVLCVHTSVCVCASPWSYEFFV